MYSQLSTLWPNMAKQLSTLYSPTEVYFLRPQWTQLLGRLGPWHPKHNEVRHFVDSGCESSAWVVSLVPRDEFDRKDRTKLWKTYENL